MRRKLDIKQSKEVVIAIEGIFQSALTDKFPCPSIIGVVSSEPGEYRLLPEISVTVCPVIKRPHFPYMQKLILREAGCKRRMILVHHNAVTPIVHDLSPTVSLAFRVYRKKVIPDYSKLDVGRF